MPSMSDSVLTPSSGWMSDWSASYFASASAVVRPIAVITPGMILIASGTRP